MRAGFVVGQKSGKWTLASLKAIGGNEIPDEHRDFVVEVAQEYFGGRRRRRASRRSGGRYDLAILVDPAEVEPPSNERALGRFTRAAESAGFNVERITRDDFARLPTFDALFIRETTSVNHHTFRFARRAVAEGLVAIDDPESIVKCTNKVFLAELMDRHGVPTPRTLIVHRDNRDRVGRRAGSAGDPQAAGQFVLPGRGQGPRRGVACARRSRACWRSRTWSSPRSTCRRSTTGASASSTASPCSPAATGWPRDTGRSSSATRPGSRRPRAA